MSCFAFHLNSRTSAYCIILDAERFYQVFCSFAHRIVKKVLAQARYEVFIVNYHQPKIQNCINAYNYRVMNNFNENTKKANTRIIGCFYL